MGNPTMQRPRTQQRTLQLVIEGYVKARGDIDAEADALALEVEQIIGADPTLGGLVKDATLDTTSRKLYLNAEVSIVISDTVGFIRDLPHQLVAAFRATLEETVHADLLLHVVDSANDQRDRQIEEDRKSVV